jgi:tetratricopeptide (TPR) repeat protein
MPRPTTPAFGPQQRTTRQPPISILDGMLEKALKHHRQDALPEAERLYRRILTIDPRHAASLHLLGTLAHQIGRRDVAAQLIRAAIAIDPRQAAFHCNLGAVLQAQGALDEAAGAYREALDRNSNLAEAHMNLGTIFNLQGKPEQAASRFRAAITLHPDLAEAHMNLGNILQSQGKLAEALSSHDRALTLKPGFAEACFNRANTLQALGRLDEAIKGYHQALSLKPGMPQAHGNLGNTFQAQQRLDEAAASYERALALMPDYAEAHYNLGNVRRAQDLLAEAVACYQRALELKPNLPEAHYNLGNTLQAQGHLEAASESFARAIALRPTYAEAHYNLGCVRQQQGRLNEALASMQQSLALKPDYAQARFGLALAQIQSGDLAAGWRNYESRWQSADHDTPMRPYPQPLWTGETLSNGRLLLWGEQGIGDEIMFAGLIPDALSTGNRITLECDPRLQPLFVRSFPQIEVLASAPRSAPAKVNRENPPFQGAGLDPASRTLQRENRDGNSEQRTSSRAPSFPQPLAERVGNLASSPAIQPALEAGIAAHLPTGSLSGLFRTTEQAFAASTSPYLKPDSALRAHFRACYSDGRSLIGLAWQTKNTKTGRKRSIDLAQFAPLFALPGIRWVSLQYGDFDALERQAEDAGAPLLIDRTVDQFAGIDRFAAQVGAMDQVVTIDNSTAHLAGALGLPTLLLLPFAADWRWLQKRDRSPWYPTMQLFRQAAAHDWSATILSVRNALAGELNKSSMSLL